MQHKQTCPLKHDLDRLMRQGRGMQKTLRRTRRDLQLCQVCEQQAECPVMQSFNAQVAQAIREVNEEWVTEEQRSAEERRQAEE